MPGLLLAAVPAITGPTSSIPSPVSGTVDVNFSAQITASNSPTRFTASNLPPGLVLNTSTGLISGKPKLAGFYRVDIAAANADGVSFAQPTMSNRTALYIKIWDNSAATVLPTTSNVGWAPFDTWTLGLSGSRQIAASNLDDVSRFAALDPLPPGLILDGAALSGTPTESGLFGTRVAVTNRDGYVIFPITVFVPTPGSDPARPVLDELAGVTCLVQESVEIVPTVTGVVERYAAGALPAGLHLNPRTGVVSGSPRVAGTYAISIAARGPAGWGDPASFTLTVVGAPTFYSSGAISNRLWEENVAVSTSASFDSTQPATLSVQNLPPGVTFSGLSTISGTPTQKGVYDVELTIGNANGSRSRTETIVVVGAAWEVLPDTDTSSRNAITFGAGRFVRVGMGGVIEYSADGAAWTAAASGTTTTLTAVGFGGGRFVAAGSSVALESADGITWSAMDALPVSNTPTGVACDDAGVIVFMGSRTASAPTGGTWTLTTSFPGVSSPKGAGFHDGRFVVYGSHATTVSMSDDGVIWASDTLPNNTTVDLRLGECGDRFVRSSAVTSKVETSTDGVTWTSRPPYKFSYLRAFAYGNGTIVGLARLSSQHLLVRNQNGWEGEVIAPSELTGSVGQSFDFHLTGTEGPTAFAAWGLPAGLTVDTATGRIHGTVTQGGSTSAGVTSINAVGPAKTKSISFKISESSPNPPSLSGSPIAGALQGKTFAYDPQIAGAKVSPTRVAPRLTYSVQGLPPGVSMDAADGTLSGVPTTPGRYQIDYTVSGGFATQRQRVAVVVASGHRVPSEMSPGTANVRPIWFSDGLFAAELAAGTAVFSTDGETWSAPVTVASGESLSGFAQGGGLSVFSTPVAVYVSTDRVAWTRHALTGTSNLNVRYLGGRFLLVNADQHAPKIVTSIDGDMWQEIALETAYPGRPVSIAYGAGTFVCNMASESAVQISTDGVTWERVATPTPLGARIFYQGGQFVVPSYTPATSSDGRNWTLHELNRGIGLPDGDIVPFGDWLAGYANGSMCFSVNGLDWQRFAGPSGGNLTGIAAGNGRLLLRISQAGPATVLVSGDEWVLPTNAGATRSALVGQTLDWSFATANAASGLIWHAENLPAGLSINNAGLVSGVPLFAGLHRSMVWAETAGGRVLEPVVLTLDCKESSGDAPMPTPTFTLPDAVFGQDYESGLPVVSDGLGLSVGVSGLPAGLSFDPKTMLISGIPTEPGTTEVTIIASDSYGTTNWTLPLRVLNGTFTSLSAKPPHSMALAWDGEDALVALTGGPTSTSGVISFSADCFVWETVVSSTFDNPLPSLCAVSWGNGQFVAVGREGAILTSSDGRNWTRRTAVSSADLLGVAQGAGKWVAVGVGGAAAVSNDGAAWTAVTTGVALDLTAVAHDGSAFFAVGKTGTIRRSTDGVNWSAVTSPVTRDLRSIAIGGSRYVIGSTSGRILTSGNGTTWTDQFIGSSTNVASSVYGLSYHPDQGFGLTLYNYVNSSNYDTRFMRSTNGVTWRQVSGYPEVSRSLLLTDDLVLSGNSSSTLRVYPVHPVDEIQTVTTVTGYPNVPFHFDLAPWNIVGPISATGLPDGLSVNPSTGLISGTPTTSGRSVVQVRAAGSAAATMTLKIDIMAGLPTPLADFDGIYRFRFVRGQVVDVPLQTLHPTNGWRSAPQTSPLPAGIILDTEKGRLVGRAEAAGTFYHQFYAGNPWGEVLGTLEVWVDDPENTFSRQPEPQVASSGGSATFTADAGLPGNVRYQWFRNGVRLVDGGRVSGANSASLSIQDITTGDAGMYELLMENGLTSVLSEAVALTVDPTLTGYAAWAFEHAAELDDDDATAKPFGDGVSNLLRYALGLPLSPVAHPDYMVTELRDGRLVLRYVRPKGRADISYAVQSADQLNGAWTEDEVISEKTADDGQWETWEASAPIAGDRRFVRLRVEISGE